jgi:preprotein translocase subunit SecG
MFIVLMILTIIVGTLMAIVILMQSSKGQGLSGAFGGASGGVGTMLGVRRASDVLAKATWVLAGVFVFLIFLINLAFLPTATTEESIIQRSAAEQPISPVERQQMQQQPGGQQPGGQQPGGQQPGGQQPQQQQQQAPAGQQPPPPAGK